MAVNLNAPDKLQPVAGVRLATGAAGIKRADRDDLVLLCFEPGTTVAGVFTRSSFRAAPVELAAARIGAGEVRALLINSGNANAATGQAGLDDARSLCAALAETLRLPDDAVAPFSTGVIGERLPVAKIAAALGGLPERLREDGWEAAARAIMTTDTVPKACSETVSLGGVDCRITGMAKGAGMIRPDMATMLAFVCTDAPVSRSCLEALTRDVVERSFNRITVDGDTSTNDSFVVAATGALALDPIDDPRSDAAAALRAGLMRVATSLAQAIVRDAEGATRFVTVSVGAGRTEAECLQVAYTIAESPLVKTALFAGDPNWGRLAMAIGRAGVEDLDVTGVSVCFDDVLVMSGGVVAPTYTEEAGAAVLAREEFGIRVDLGRGSASAEVWTSDLSYDYVRINAEYRT